MRRSRDASEDTEPTASREAARRKITRIAYWSLPFIIIFGVLNFLPAIPLPWAIAKVAVEIVFVVVFGVAVIRFSLWQRAEYWRERGRDPKHPERFPGQVPTDKTPS